jgi:hypothetical protein
VNNLISATSEYSYTGQQYTKMAKEEFLILLYYKFGVSIEECH